MIVIKAILILFALALAVAVLGVAVDRQRNRPKVRTILQSHKDRAIVGDGAWIIGRQPQRSARVRDIEPRGF
jgi:hypothetical protein